MAFNVEGFERGTSAANTSNPNIWCYESSDDYLSDIAADNYFLPVYGLSYPITVNELIMVRAVDGVALLQFSTVNALMVKTTAFNGTSVKAGLATSNVGSGTNQYTFNAPGTNSDEILQVTMSVKPVHSEPFDWTASIISDQKFIINFNQTVTGNCLVYWSTFPDTN